MALPTILVVDDDDSIREIAALSLNLYAGWTVVTADDGFRAVEVARSSTVDAILIDFMMPGMDGLTAFRQLQEDPSTAHIPVILLTAKARVGPSQPWDDTGIRGVIAKPFDARTLADRVTVLLGWHVDSLDAADDDGSTPRAG